MVDYNLRFAVLAAGVGSSQFPSLQALASAYFGRWPSLLRARSQFSEGLWRGSSFKLALWTWVKREHPFLLERGLSLLFVPWASIFFQELAYILIYWSRMHWTTAFLKVGKACLLVTQKFNFVILVRCSRPCLSGSTRFWIHALHNKLPAVGCSSY